MGLPGLRAQLLQGAGFLGLSLVNPAHSVWGFTALATVAVLGLVKLAERSWR